MIRSSHCRLEGGVGSVLGRKKNRRWRVCMKSLSLSVISFNHSMTSPVVERSFGLQIQGGRDIEQCDLSIDPLVCSFHCCDFFSLERGNCGNLQQLRWQHFLVPQSHFLHTSTSSTVYCLSPRICTVWLYNLYATICRIVEMFTEERISPSWVQRYL